MYLLIDSRDKLSSSDTSSKFTIRLNNLIPQVKNVKLKRVLMNHVLYNISSEYSNNTFVFYETANTTVTITSGYYTPNQLASSLQTLLNANSQHYYTYTVTYSSVTSMFTISCTNSFIVQVSSLGRVLGFTAATSSATSQVSDSVTTINDPLYMYLDLSCFSSSSSYTSSDIRTTFILTNHDDETEYNGLPNMCLTMSTPVDLQTFTVVLRNKDGSQVQMRGANFAFLLEIN